MCTGRWIQPSPGAIPAFEAIVALLPLDAVRKARRIDLRGVVSDEEGTLRGNDDLLLLRPPFNTLWLRWSAHSSSEFGPKIGRSAAKATSSRVSTPSTVALSADRTEGDLIHDLKPTLSVWEAVRGSVKPDFDVEVVAAPQQLHRSVNAIVKASVGSPTSLKPELLKVRKVSIS